MTTRNSYLNILVFWMFQVIFAMLAVIFFYMAPKIDGLFFPVVKDFQILEIVHSPGGDYAMISGVLLKTRGECRRVDLMAFSSPPGAGEPVKVHEIVTQVSDPNFDRPAGSQEFGPWTVYRPEYPLGPIINFSIRHRCNYLWETTTDLGSFLTVDLFPNAIIQGVEE